MTSTKKSRSNKRTATAKETPVSSDLEGAWLRTQQLVESLLETLAAGIKSPESIPEHWERLFGAKDSVVVSLQKLVALLIELHQNLPTDKATVEATPAQLEPHEVEMLEAWMKGQVRE
ncbi:MAG: hypothetical protein ACK5WQ_07205 [Alphaproteobacteria bacterium]